MSVDRTRTTKEPRFSKDLVAASARPLILSILSGGESYGYAIITRIQEVSAGEIEWSEGMLYPLLHKLESEKLIRSRWEKADSGRRRKYYRITRSGLRHLEGARQNWVTVHNTLAQLWGVKPCAI